MKISLWFAINQRAFYKCRSSSVCSHWFYSQSLSLMTTFLVTCLYHRVYLRTYIVQPWRERQHFPPKSRSLPTRIDNATTQKTTILHKEALVIWSSKWLTDNISLRYTLFWEARGSVVGWDTMLLVQAGRSPVSSPGWSGFFSIYLLFPAALWPRTRLSL
jgi:hypothetical protein